MNKKYSNKDEFHYINPNYRNKIKGNLKTTYKPSSLTPDTDYVVSTNKKELQSPTKHNDNSEYDFAFRGNSELLEKYNYVPYYDKKKQK